MRRHNFKKLQIWNLGMEIVSMVYNVTNKFPEEEKFGLKSQMNRCAVSIPSNIAEGSSKSSSKHFINFLEVSLGSSFELETQVIICLNQKIITETESKELENKITVLQKMISNFIESISKNLES